MIDDHAAPDPRELFPGAFLALFDDDGACRFQLHARPDGPRDGVDPVSELAVFAAVSVLGRASMIIPVRMRDLHDGTIVSRPLVVTDAERLPDGRLELDAFAAVVPVGDRDEPPPSSFAVDPAVSPVGSMLCDVLSTTVLSVRLEEAAAVLESWGHVVLAVDEELPPVDHARLGRARYHVHKLADELARRHRPMALGDDARRPAAPANLPPGFLPACPL